MSGAESLSLGLLFITLSYTVSADYGDGRPYPISGSWFKDRTNTTDIQQALEQFKGIGGDTIISYGVQFINSTKENVRNNAHLHGCVVGQFSLRYFQLIAFSVLFGYSILRYYFISKY